MNPGFPFLFCFDSGSIPRIFYLFILLPRTEVPSWSLGPTGSFFFFFLSLGMTVEEDLVFVWLGLAGGQVRRILSVIAVSQILEGRILHLPFFLCVFVFLLYVFLCVFLCFYCRYLVGYLEFLVVSTSYKHLHSHQPCADSGQVHIPISVVCFSPTPSRRRSFPITMWERFPNLLLYLFTRLDARLFF